MSQMTVSAAGDHVLDGQYIPNESDMIHTPVVSPASIKDPDGDPINGGGGSGSGTTELVNEDKNVWYQLRLDNNYVIHWDIDKVLSGDSNGNLTEGADVTHDFLKLLFDIPFKAEWYLSYIFAFKIILFNIWIIAVS